MGVPPPPPAPAAAKAAAALVARGGTHGTAPRSSGGSPLPSFSAGNASVATATITGPPPPPPPPPQPGTAGSPSSVSTINAPLCLLTIVVLPFLLLVVACMFTWRKAPRISVLYGHRVGRRGAGAGAGAAPNRRGEGEGTGGAAGPHDVHDDNGMSAFERAVNVRVLSSFVGSGLLTLALLLLWDERINVIGHRGIWGGVGIRVTPTLLAVWTFVTGFRKRPLWIVAIGTPVLMGLSLAEARRRLHDSRSIGEWAIRAQFWHPGGVTARTYLHGTRGRTGSTPTMPMSSPPEVPLLARVAVIVDAATWSLGIPIFLVSAYWKMFSVSQILKSYLYSRKSGLRSSSPRRRWGWTGRWRWRTRRNQIAEYSRSKKEWKGATAEEAKDDEEDDDSGEKSPRWEKVHRIFSRWDVSFLVADEYCLHNPSKATPEMANKVFGRMERAQKELARVAVWFGRDLCLCCNFVPPIPEIHARSGRVPSTASVDLEPICTYQNLSGVCCRLYGTTRSLSGRGGLCSDHGGGSRKDEEECCGGSLVASVDSFLRLLALYKASEFTCVRLFRDPNFLGVFPVSRYGLRSLVQGPGDGAASTKRWDRRLYLQELRLSADQWQCLLQSIRSPHILVGFYGYRHATNPEAFRALVQVLREDECVARIQVMSITELPLPTLDDVATALEANRSVREIYVGFRSPDDVPIGGENRDSRARTRYEDEDSAAHRTLMALVRRQSPLDVLGVRVSVFMPRTWDTLWKEVVPSCALNLKCLKIFTGVFGPELGAALPNDAVNEEDMIRFLCQSKTLCTFEYFSPKIHGSDNDERWERIDTAVGPCLRFNQFWRLIRTLEVEHNDDKLRTRWFGTLLRRSVARESPSWCYMLLRTNSGTWWTCLDRAAATQAKSRRIDAAVEKKAQ